MATHPWLTIIGIHEDGIDGLASQAVISLKNADVIMAPTRHLQHVTEYGAEKISWPVPYSDGIDVLMKQRGNNVVVLASGDPFHFGAASVLIHHLERTEWCVIPAPSSFALITASLGWKYEDTVCLGIHAKPLDTLRIHLHHGNRLILLLRDAQAVSELGSFLCNEGFENSSCFLFSHLKTTHNTPLNCSAQNLNDQHVHAPVSIAIDLISHQSTGMSLASGKPDSLFIHDGQITKQPIRALSLSALAPRPHQHLWDIGSGSGSIALEWMMSHAQQSASAIEIRADRAAIIKQNAAHYGMLAPSGGLSVHCADIVDIVPHLPLPDAVFIGGGLNAQMFDVVYEAVPLGCRIVVNSVTIESEAVLVAAQKRYGGELIRIELSHLKQLGSKQSWHAHYPIVQWVVVK